MLASIEPLSGVLRVWADGRQYGEPYEWVASVRYISPHEIEVLGYTTPITRDMYRAVIRLCDQSGIRRILTVRYRAGRRREKWVNVMDWRAKMGFTGNLKTTLTEKGRGHVLNSVLECQSDGQPFCRGEVQFEWANTQADADNQYAARIAAVASELNGEIASYDDLCLMQAKVVDGLDDLNHLGQLYATLKGVDLPKTEAFLAEVAAEDRAERAAIREAKRSL